MQSVSVSQNERHVTFSHVKAGHIFSEALYSSILLLLGEHRPDGPVYHPSRQYLPLGHPYFASEEVCGNPPGGRRLLPVAIEGVVGQYKSLRPIVLPIVDGERKEASRGDLSPADGCGENGRLAQLGHGAPVGQASQLARAQLDGGAGPAAVDG